MLGSEGAEANAFKVLREAHRAQEQRDGRGGKREEKESFSERCDVDTASVTQLLDFWKNVVVDKGVGVISACCNGPKATQTVIGDCLLCGGCDLCLCGSAT